MKNSNIKSFYFSLLAITVSVLAITLVYAGFTQTLRVNGSAEVKAAKWYIHFDNLSAAQTEGQLNLVTPAEISTSKTHIGDYRVVFYNPGSSLTYTFDVVNEGNFNAEITSLTKTAPTCSGNSEVCNYLTYELKYTTSGEDYNIGDSVAVGDTLAAGESRGLILTLSLSAAMTADKLPSEDIIVSNLGITIIYSQDGGYVENNGGSGSSEPQDNQVTFYFQTPPNWSNTYVYLYNDTTGVENAAWPGQVASFVTGNIYKFDISQSTLSNYKGVIFNNNTRQTVDLPLSSDVNNKIFVPELNKTSNTVRVIYNDSPTWNAHIYVWKNGGSELLGWPGVTMSEVSNGGFSYTIDKSSVAYDKMIFNNGNSGAGNQTDNINVPTCQDMTYKRDGSSSRKFYFGSWHNYNNWLSSEYSAWRNGDYVNLQLCD